MRACVLLREGVGARLEGVGTGVDVEREVVEREDVEREVAEREDVERQDVEREVEKELRMPKDASARQGEAGEERVDAAGDLDP